MNWNDAIFQVISLHTFSNVWYWLAVAVSWASASHWILGVPFDMIFRAQRYGDQAAIDLEQIVAINVRRLKSITDVAGLGLIGIAAFFLTGLAWGGFFYGFELAQGVFLLAFPMTIVVVMNFSLSHRFSIAQPTGEELAGALIRLRFWIQAIAMTSIFLTAMYGMYHNISTPLGF